MTEFLLLQLGRRLKFHEAGLVNPAEVGITRVGLYRDQSMTESDKWVVIKVFDHDQSRKLRGLMYILGNQECTKLLESLFEVEMLDFADA